MPEQATLCYHIVKARDVRPPESPVGILSVQRTTCIKAIFFGPHLRSKYESGNKSISLHDFIRPIFLVFHFGFSLDLAVHQV